MVSKIVNYTPQEILSGIYKAVHEVQSLDRKVDMVSMPYDKYYTLMADMQFAMSHVSEINMSGSIGKLWGMDITLNRNNEFKVISEPINGLFPNTMPVPNPDGEWQNNIVREWQNDWRARVFKDVNLFGGKLELLKKNLTIIVKSRARPIAGITENESRAIETLREMISETEYRRYIKNQFILVKGLSGDIYQIFRDKSHTIVWHGGKKVAEICVRIRDCLIPPTDNVIAFKTIIETNEDEFKKLGNVYKMKAA